MEKTLLYIAVILVFTKIGGIISKKFKMPEVLGALLAGVIIGPAVFNIVQYDKNLELLSNLGVIFLMFGAGLETDVEKFKKAGLSSFVIALLGVIMPFVLGFLGLYVFTGNMFENLFISVILTATSVSITVETLTELGKLNSNAGTNILGAAVIDDVLGLIAISVLLAVTGETSSSSSLTLTLLEIVLFCGISVLAVIYVPKIVNKLKIKNSRTFFTFCIASAVFFAFLAEKAGIAAITGAYICGLMMSKFDQKEYLERNVRPISSGFLSPVFFASVGLEANLKGVDVNALYITIAMFVIAVIGKVLGCGLGARLFKMSKTEALQIGFGMISRGEVAIITANICLQKKIISQEIFLPTILVVILTTVITPALLKISFSHKYDMVK